MTQSYKMKKILSSRLTWRIVIIYLLAKMKNGAEAMTTKTRIEKSVGHMLRIGAKNSDPVEAAMSEHLKAVVERESASFRKSLRKHRHAA